MKFSKIMDSAVGLICAVITLAAVVFSLIGNGEIPYENAFENEPAVRTTVSEFRFDRESVRKMETEQLLFLSQDENTDETIRLRAQEALKTLAASMEAEATIEAVLLARGHEDAVVTVHEGSVNVVIKSGYDNKAESAFILDLVMRETGESAGNVKIIAVDEKARD